MEEFGTSPYGEAAEFGVAPPPMPPARAALEYELRPLSLGEILDRTFSMYRRRFWLYAGLSSIAAIVPTLSTLAQFAFAMPSAKADPNLAAKKGFVFLGIVLVATLVYVVAYSLIMAATVVAVTAAAMGEETSIGQALKKARPHWGRYVLIMLWQGLSAVWIPIVLFMVAAGLLAVPALRIVGALLLVLSLGSIVYVAIAYIRNSLGIVASVVEDLPVRKAMRRSKVLVAGHKGRVFAILLLTWVLHLVAAVFQGMSGFFVGLSHGWVKVLAEAVALLITYASTSVVVPVVTIALVIFYMDERVRKEGYDVEVLMLRGGTAPVADALDSPFTSEWV